MYKKSTSQQVNKVNKVNMPTSQQSQQKKESTKSTLLLKITISLPKRSKSQHANKSTMALGGGGFIPQISYRPPWVGGQLDDKVGAKAPT